jgi:O-acetylserine/cysteine efflux transporter
VTDLGRAGDSIPDSTPAADAAGVRIPAAAATGAAAAAVPSAGDRAALASARPRSTRMERTLAEAATIGVMALWAGNFIVVKTAILDVPPIGYSFVRFLLGGLVLLAICLAVEGSVRIPRGDAARLAVLGALGFGAYQMLWTTALQSTTAGNSALIVAATPIFTMLVAAAVGSDTLTPAKGFGAFVGFIGVALVIGAGSGLAFDARLAGDLMTLAAAFLWALYVSFGASLLRRHSPLRTTSWTITFGALALAPVGLWQFATEPSVTWTPAAVGAVLYSGLLAAALGNVVVFRGIRLLGPTRITTYQFLVPALAVILAAVVLGEAIHPEQVVGGTIIVLGILVARSDRVAPRRPRVPASS